MINTCSVVDEFCLSPANVIPQVNIRSKCHWCGEYVCRNCSSVRNLGRIKKRLCNRCQVEMDGNDKIVLRRKYQLAR